jgi:xanthine dehydrogenase accessory factor
MQRRPDLYEEIARIRADGAPAALATVIGTRGSTPGRSAMKMLIRCDGSTMGTVGGGSMEEQVRQMGLLCLADETCRRDSFELSTEAVDDSELICGGTVEVFVEPLTIPTVFLLGAGHLGTATARVAAVAGFRVVVGDDRASHANAERFPDAHEVLVQPFDELLAGLAERMGPASYVVIVTRSHQLDEQCAAAMLRTDARFVGMIGSKKKVARCHDFLRSEGLGDDAIGRFAAPVGLDLAAETHGEIAVAIVAEMVRVRRGAAEGAAGSKRLAPQ